MDRTPDPFKRVSWTVLRAELGVPLIHRTRHPRLPPPKPRPKQSPDVFAVESLMELIPAPRRDRLWPVLPKLISRDPQWLLHFLGVIQPANADPEYWSEELVVLPNGIYAAYDHPLLVHRDQLLDIQVPFLEMYNEHAYDISSDLYIISLKTQRVWIAFHEDAWFTFEYTPIRPPMGVVRLPSRWD